MPRIAAIPGALRAGSFNRKLIAIAARELTRAGAEVDLVDLKELALPVFDQDLETSSFPPKAKELRERLLKADAWVIATPEYNFSVPGGLKNAIDWASRPPPHPFKGKAVAVMGASGGYYGALRSQLHLRELLATMGLRVLPGQVALPKAQEAFDEKGELKDPTRQKEVATLMAALLDEVKRLQ